MAALRMLARRSHGRAVTASTSAPQLRAAAHAPVCRARPCPHAGGPPPTGSCFSAMSAAQCARPRILSTCKGAGQRGAERRARRGAARATGARLPRRAARGEAARRARRRQGCRARAVRGACVRAHARMQAACDTHLVEQLRADVGLEAVVQQDAQQLAVVDQGRQGVAAAVGPGARAGVRRGYVAWLARLWGVRQHAWWRPYPLRARLARLSHGARALAARPAAAPCCRESPRAARVPIGCLAAASGCQHARKTRPGARPLVRAAPQALTPQQSGSHQCCPSS